MYAITFLDSHSDENVHFKIMNKYSIITTSTTTFAKFKKINYASITTYNVTTGTSIPNTFAEKSIRARKGSCRKYITRKTEGIRTFWSGVDMLSDYEDSIHA